MTIGPFKLEGDRYIWILTVIFMFISLAVTFSSRPEDNMLYEMIKRLVICVAGLGLMYKIHQIDFRLFARLSKLILLLAFVVQIIAYFLGNGDTSEAGTRSIRLLPGFSLMTSDMMKFAAVIWTAVILAKSREKIASLKDLLKELTFPALIAAAVLPSNFSSAAIIFFVVMGMLMISRINFLLIMKSMVVFAFASIILIFLLNLIGFTRFETWKSRLYTGGYIPESVANRLDIKKDERSMRDKKSQPELAIMAIATTNIVYGKGPGNSDVHNILPQLDSDFSFTLILEEYGLIVSTLIMIFYLSFIYRLLYIAKKLPMGFSAYLLSGFALLISIQALINIIVSTGTGPVTGQPMPLVSHGGSSLIFTCLSLGICQSIIKEYKDKGLQIERENYD